MNAELANLIANAFGFSTDVSHVTLVDADQAGITGGDGWEVHFDTPGFAYGAADSSVKHRHVVITATETDT